MPLLLPWPIPSLDKMPRSWALKSHGTMAVVGSLLKIWADYCNTFNVYNRKVLLDAVDDRPVEKPLITVSNHTSCMDDPLLWASLHYRHLTRDNDRLRWTPGAHNVMFKTPFYNSFCALGRGIPTVRGDGVYQRAMDFSLQLLNRGRWVHVFPEAWFPWRGIVGLPRRGMRWVPTADEVGFYTPRVGRFFALGGSVPTLRGDGVYQRSMDFCCSVLNRGGRHAVSAKTAARGWVHIFPEGKINMTKHCLRLKWGVGRLVAESQVVPMVLPMWHYGMDDVLPNKRPYIPRTGKKITLLIGEPMDFTETVKELETRKATPKEKRKVITDIIEEELEALKAKAKAIHFSDCTPETYERQNTVHKDGAS